MELHFTRTNGPADEAIDQLIELVGDIYHPDIVREMILASLKAGQENNETADLKLMNTSLKEMRFTAKVFEPYHKVKKVSVFGSARTQSDEFIYEMACHLGQKLSKAGYMVITGGGPGIMQAVNEGAGTEHSFGVSIRLPFEQETNPILDGHPRNIMYKYFFTRKVAFLKQSDAIVLFPGGFGTLDEGMETLTLVQTGKRNPLPLIFVDEPRGTYWLQWLKFLERELLAQGNISATDFSLFERVESVDDAVKKIDRFYHRYHSLRYVKEKLVLRLTSGIDPLMVNELKSRFSDILIPGGDLLLSGPLPVEADEPEIAHLPRLIVDFDRRDFGRLRDLVNAINAC